MGGNHQKLRENSGKMILKILYEPYSVEFEIYQNLFIVFNVSHPLHVFLDKRAEYLSTIFNICFIFCQAVPVGQWVISESFQNIYQLSFKVELNMN